MRFVLPDRPVVGSSRSYSRPEAVSGEIEGEVAKSIGPSPAQSFPTKADHK